MPNNRPYNNHQAQQYLEALFGKAMSLGYGQIEVRAIKKDTPLSCRFHDAIGMIHLTAEHLLKNNYNVYVGVNPRVGGAGTKENVKYVVALHADIDYGSDGHKKKSVHATQEEALKALNAFEFMPSLLVNSGGGYHVYWILKDPLPVDTVGADLIESINLGVAKALGGDVGTQDLPRILRLPGTLNFKDPAKPKNVDIVHINDKRYSFIDFLKYRCESTKPEKTLPKEKQASFNMSNTIPFAGIDISTLDIGDQWKALIINGNDGTYPSRSEADMAVVTVLVNKGFSEARIKTIYQDPANGISSKYHEQPNPDQYLKRTIEAAKDFSDLTEQELLNPLFTSGVIYKKRRKTDNSYNFHLDITRYEEYIVNKYKLKFNDGMFYKFNGKCYEGLEDRNELNNLCQSELKMYRRLFTPKEFMNFIHFAAGHVFEYTSSAREDQTQYLTLNNGLFNLKTNEMLPHSPDIFTTNLLPYDYDANAGCPRFMQFLDEVFMGNKDTIMSIQEAVGYGFHKTIPTPAMFFLVGEGSNGKSVFLKTITQLFGEKNVSNTGLSHMNNEYYVLKIMGKMLNIAYENPSNSKLNMENIKAIVAGDRIPARGPYSLPIEFEPFAKHFFAMNEYPQISDNTHGTWRRIYIIEFPRIFTDKDADKALTEKLQHELPGIFNWAMEGYRRLTKNNYIFHASESMRKSKDDFKEKSDSVYSFIINRIAKADGKIKLSELYSVYVDYSHNEGFNSIQTKIQLKNRLKRNGYEVKNDSRDNNQVYVHGIRLVDKPSGEVIENIAISMKSSGYVPKIVIY